RHADDRPGPVGRVLHQPRLAGVVRGVRGAPPAADRADAVVPAPAGAGTGGRAMRQRSLALGVIVVFGYLLLYVPIVSVVVFSFNEARLASSFSCCSLRWYAKLLADDELLEAALLSLRIAIV